MHLQQIRQNYEKNYQKMIEVIQMMGGDNCISRHRKKNTPLYRQLRELQKRENYLNTLEIQMQTRQSKMCA